MATTYKKMAIFIKSFSAHTCPGTLQKLMIGEVKLVTEGGEETAEGEELIAAMKAYQEAIIVIEEFTKKYI
jgi:hypothetical protein